MPTTTRIARSGNALAVSGRIGYLAGHDFGGQEK